MGATSILKKAALTALSHPSFGLMLCRVVGERSAIVMLHRFAVPGRPHVGHDTVELRAQLAYLRAAGVALVSVEEAIAVGTSQQGNRRGPSVAYTVDDGYQDFADTGFAVFAEFDCPVTCFVVPDVVDRKCWFWWDQLDWITRHATSPTFQLDLETGSPALSWRSQDERQACVSAMVEELKHYPTARRQLCIERLARMHGVEFSDTVPADYAVMSWDTMRALEARGARFGAHTLTHPILSRCDDEQSRLEIMGSVMRIGEELRNPSPVFCYPNGTTRDFGVREMNVLRTLPAITAALSTVPARVVSPHAGTNTDDRRWQVPRFAFDGRPGAMARLLFL